MKIAHLFAGGNIGGIECLFRSYVKYSKHQHIVLVLWGNGPILDDLRKLGIKVIYLNLSSKNIIGAYFKIRKICCSEKIDIIIAQHEAILSYIVLFLLKRTLFPIYTIAYAHCNASFMLQESENSVLNLRKKVISFTLRNVDSVIAISENVKQSLVAYFCIALEKISVLYNGVELAIDDNSIFQDHDLSRKNLSHTNIIYVGRLIKEKGVQTIIKAIKLLNSNYQLTIVGDGPYREYLEKLSIGCEERIFFVGVQKNIYNYLKKADIFVHVPDCEEGFGLTVVEAMSTGIVCIVGNRGAMSEIIDNGINGYLITSGDPNVLAKKIEEVSQIINSKNIKKIVLNARNKSNLFSIKKYTDDLDRMLLTNSIRHKNKIKK